VMIHILAKQRKCENEFSSVSDVKTAIILIEFLIHQNKINGTIF